MIRFRFVFLPFSLSFALMGGCTIRIGSDFSLLGEDNGSSGVGTGSGTGPIPRLPTPDVWRVDPPLLDAEQQQKQDEVDQFIVESYGGYQIVQTIQGYSGQITDWVDSNSIPGADLQPPPPTWTASDLSPPDGAVLGRAEVELYPELQGPVGTTPIHRPDFSAYVLGFSGATSLQDFVDNEDVPGRPEGKYRLYSTLFAPIPNMGAAGSINQFEGDIEKGTFSIIEIAVICRGLDDNSTMEIVGATVGRNRASFSDAQTRIRIEHFTAGPPNLKHGKGGWDGKVSGFVPQRGRPYGSDAVVIGSTPGLGTQVEHRFDISQDSSGNWWVAHNGNTLGYYPASLFDMLNLGACEAQWYGEVYDPTPTDWTWTDMGSGELPAGGPGYGYLSYIRNPTFRDLLFGPWFPGDQIGFYGPKENYEPLCYARTDLLKQPVGSPWEYFFYLGGPGGDAPGGD